MNNPGYLRPPAGEPDKRTDRELLLAILQKVDKQEKRGNALIEALKGALGQFFAMLRSGDK